MKAANGFVYYCKKAPPAEDTLPAKGLKKFRPYTERMYEADVDCMVWGNAVYSRRLEPWEIMRYGLISAPIE